MLNTARRNHGPRHGVARSRDESGSIIVALIVIMIVMAVISVFAATVAGNQLLIVHRQNTSSGLAAAEAGVSDALFRIDQLQAGDYAGPSPAPSFCVNVATCPPGYRAITATVPAGRNGSAGYVASYKPEPSDSWVVQSKGSNRTSSAAVEETLTRSTQFPYAVFGNGGLSYQGRSSGQFGTYAPGGDPGSETTGGTCTTSTPTGTAGCVRIGSNGTINCNGSLPPNVTYWIYSGGGGLTTCQSANTGNTTTSPTLNNLPVPAWPSGGTPLPTYPPGSANCLIGSNTAKEYGGTAYDTLDGGTTYTCAGELTIDGDVKYLGPGTAKIYVIPPATDPAYTGTAIDITWSVNPSSTPFINYAPDAPLPDAQNLEIFTNSKGYVGDSSGASNAYVLGGIVDAPDAYLVGNGCKSTYYGALIINTLACNGAPNLTVYYDDALNAVKGAWQSSGYRQVPPSTVP